MKTISVSVIQLRQACAKICWQNWRLLKRITAADFQPGHELDCTLNKAQYYLVDFFDALKLFRHGDVPYRSLKWTVKSTTQLVDAIIARYGWDAESRRLAERAGHVFRSAQRVWGNRRPVRILPQEEYEAEMSKWCDGFLDALDDLNLRLSTLEFEVPAKAEPAATLARVETTVVKAIDRHFRKPRERDFFSQRSLALLFEVTRNTIGNWQRGVFAAPEGFSEACRTKAKESLCKIAERYRLTREKADAFTSKRIVRNLSEEALFNRRVS